MKTERTPQLGDIYYMSFTGDGSVQRGFRPGLVFQNNTGNKYSPNVIALPLTGRLKKTTQPTHVVLPASDTGLNKDSMVLCENPVCIPRERIGGYITTLPDRYMALVAEAHLLASSAIAYVDPKALEALRQKAVSLNAVSAV